MNEDRSKIAPRCVVQNVKLFLSEPLGTDTEQVIYFAPRFRPDELMIKHIKSSKNFLVKKHRFFLLTYELLRNSFFHFIHLARKLLDYAHFYFMEKPAFIIWRAIHGKQDLHLPCLRPMSDLHINSNHTVYFCCPLWLPIQIGDFHRSDPHQILNSIASQRIRMRFYRGDWSICRTHLCSAVGDPNFEAINKTKLSQMTGVPIQIRHAVSRRQLVIPPTGMFVTELLHQYCNVECVFCCTYLTRRHHVLKDKFYSYVLDNSEKIKTIGFAGGEPFTNPDLKKILREFVKKDVNFHFTSNFNKIDEETRSLLKEIKIKGMHCSLNAGDKETYERVILRGNWDSVMANLDFVNKLRKNTPFSLTFSIVVTKANYKSIINYIKVAAQKNASLIEFNPMLSTGKNRHLHLDEADRQEIAKMLKDPVFAEFSRIIVVNSLQSIVEEKPYQ